MAEFKKPYSLVPQINLRQQNYSFVLHAVFINANIDVFCEFSWYFPILFPELIFMYNIRHAIYLWHAEFQHAHSVFSGWVRDRWWIDAYKYRIAHWLPLQVSAERAEGFWGFKRSGGGFFCFVFFFLFSFSYHPSMGVHMHAPATRVQLTHEGV